MVFSLVFTSADPLLLPRLSNLIFLCNECPSLPPILSHRFKLRMMTASRKTLSLEIQQMIIVNIVVDNMLDDASSGVGNPKGLRFVKSLLSTLGAQRFITPFQVLIKERETLLSELSPELIEKRENASRKELSEWGKLMVSGTSDGDQCTNSPVAKRLFTLATIMRRMGDECNWLRSALFVAKQT